MTDRKQPTVGNGDYKKMKAAADAAIRGNSAKAAQFLVMQTERGEISVFPNDLSAEREERILSELHEPLSAVLCAWAGGQLDVPSMRVRKGLMDLDPRNAEAAVFLVGERGINARRLMDCFPLVLRTKGSISQ
jgi:hypothetical protein